MYALGNDFRTASNSHWHPKFTDLSSLTTVNSLKIKYIVYYINYIVSSII